MTPKKYVFKTNNFKQSLPVIKEAIISRISFGNSVKVKVIFWRRSEEEEEEEEEGEDTTVIEEDKDNGEDEDEGIVGAIMHVACMFVVEVSDLFMHGQHALHLEGT